MSINYDLPGASLYKLLGRGFKSLDEALELNGEEELSIEAVVPYLQSMAQTSAALTRILNHEVARLQDLLEKERARQQEIADTHPMDYDDGYGDFFENLKGQESSLSGDPMPVTGEVPPPVTNEELERIKNEVRAEYLASFQLQAGTYYLIDQGEKNIFQPLNVYGTLTIGSPSDEESMPSQQTQTVEATSGDVGEDSPRVPSLHEREDFDIKVIPEEESAPTEMNTPARPDSTHWSEKALGNWASYDKPFFPETPFGSSLPVSEPQVEGPGKVHNSYQFGGKTYELTRPVEDLLKDGTLKEAENTK